VDGRPLRFGVTGVTLLSVTFVVMPKAKQHSAQPRESLLMDIPGTSPMTGSSRTSTHMVAGSSVAAALAVLPTDGDAPRVIQQFTSVFLVSRLGELWRVYDTADPNGAERLMPSSLSTRRYRLFMGLARKAQIRLFEFAERAPRDADPVALQAQLDASVSQ
jgi:hypothetical protein